MLQNWKWKNYPQDGCRGSWHWTINAPGSKCPSKVWPVFSTTNKTFAPVCDHRWNLSPLLHPRDKTAVKAVETCCVTTTKGSTFGQKGLDLTFLKCERHSADRLSYHWPNNYGTILRKPPRPTTGKDTWEKATGLAREKVIFHQDNALLHTSVIAKAKINELRYKLFCISHIHLIWHHKTFISSPWWKFSSVDGDVVGNVINWGDNEAIILDTWWIILNAMPHLSKIYCCIRTYSC